LTCKFNFTTTGKYPTTLRKFLVDYLQGGEGRSQAKRAVGASTKRMVGGVGEAVEVDGVLQGRRQGRAPGEAVEAMVCSGGEAIEGVLRALAVSKT
jgi:hypothetical protein